MQPSRSPWMIALALSAISAIVLFLGPGSYPALAPPPPDEGFIELASVGQSDGVSVRAEIIEDGQNDTEMMLYSTNSATGGDFAGEWTMELPDGETLSIEGADLALGKRFVISQRSFDRIRERLDGPTDAEGTARQKVFTMATELNRASRHRPLVLEGMALESSPERPEEVEGPAPQDPPIPRPPLESPTSLALTLTAGAYRFAEAGGWEVPIYVIAKRQLAGGDELAATPVPVDMAILLEAPGTTPRTVNIQAGRPRSTEDVYLPLRRRQGLTVTATDLAGDAAPGRLELTWRAHGPKFLTLKAYPANGEAYATRLSPIQLQAYVELDEQHLRPGRPLPLRVASSKNLTIEPTNAVLGADGEPVDLTILGAGDVAETLKLHLPDLDLETEIAVRFRRPYLFLVLATLCGVLGVIVARRRQLFEQSKMAIFLEILAAATGGVLLYAAFLMQWLPTPVFLIGALPASAVGVLGGYAGEAVFQILAKVLGVGR